MTTPGDADAEPGLLQRRAFFGRSKGKTLRSHQARLMAELLPQLAIADAALGEPQKLFGFTPARIELEIGFGGGEHLCRRALEAPDTGFIGCEPFVNGVAKLLASVDELGLKNIRVCAGEAGALIGRLPPKSLDRVYLLYPDPWPKRRQRKRRLVSPETLAELSRVLKFGAEVRFATDIDDYAGWTLKRFCKSSVFEWVAHEADDWRRAWEGWEPTRYEIKARAEGRPSAYFTFRRLPDENSAKSSKHFS